MKSKGEKESWSFQEIESFMKQFIQVLYEVKNYLLDVNCLSLDPGHIYMSDGRFYFCYCPALQGDILGKFHILTEYFVKETDYEDKDGVYLAYELHRASMGENYNIEQALEGILERKEREMEKVKPKKMDGAYDLQEEMFLDDWVAEQEMGGNVIMDRQNVWGFVSKRLKKRKERRLEEWEELGDGEE